MMEGDGEDNLLATGSWEGVEGGWDGGRFGGGGCEGGRGVRGA